MDLKWLDFECYIHESLYRNLWKPSCLNVVRIFHAPSVLLFCLLNVRIYVYHYLRYSFLSPSVCLKIKITCFLETGLLYPMIFDLNTSEVLWQHYRLFGRIILAAWERGNHRGDSRMFEMRLPVCFVFNSCSFNRYFAQILYSGTVYSVECSNSIPATTVCKQKIVTIKLYTNTSYFSFISIVLLHFPYLTLITAPHLYIETVDGTIFFSDQPIFHYLIFILSKYEDIIFTASFSSVYKKGTL